MRALLPLAGRTLLEYQVRCAAAAGTAPIVVVVERVPQALQDAFERLRLDGIGVFPVSDVHEAVSRFEAGSMILVIGDGIAPPADLVTTIGEEPEPALATVPDDEAHEMFERIDSESRWAGVALVDSQTLGSTAAILGDWDLQSTLLRRAMQDGAVRWPVGGDNGAEPLLVERAEQLDGFQRTLAGRVARAAARLGQPLCASADRGIRDRAADGDAVSGQAGWCGRRLRLTLAAPGASAAAGSAPGWCCCSCRPRSTSSPAGWRRCA